MRNQLHLIERLWSRKGRTRITRAFDISCSMIGLFLLSPLLTLIAGAIKLSDRGPVLYRQERIGKDFRPFWLIKFRTMRVGADRSGLLTARGDSRVTRVGRFLREYKLDELPQLCNVLAGDMQLVGSRPEVPMYVEMFKSQYALILREAPGITDPASLAYRQEERLFLPNEIEQQYVSKILPNKIQLSLAYQDRRTLMSDMRILVQTVLGRG